MDDFIHHMEMGTDVELYEIKGLLITIDCEGMKYADVGGKLK